MLRGKNFEIASVGLLGVSVRVPQTGWIKLSAESLLLHSSLREQKSERNMPESLVLSQGLERIYYWPVSAYRWSVFSLNLLVYYLP